MTKKGWPMMYPSCFFSYCDSYYFFLNYTQVLGEITNSTSTDLLCMTERDESHKK